MATRNIADVIVLGRGVPERISQGRTTVCVAGWSPSEGFVRLYPTRVDSPLRTWSIVDVEVERNPQDTREESWKFPESRSSWENINKHIQQRGILPRQDRPRLIDELAIDCVNHLNDRKRSLGLIRPQINRKYLAPNPKRADWFTSPFPFVEHASVLTKRDHMIEPRIQYRCGPNCQTSTWHDQQLLDWGCYLWCEKNPGREQEIWRNMRMEDTAYQHALLIGNQARYRTSFMIIAVLWQKAEVQLSFALERT